MGNFLLLTFARIVNRLARAIRARNKSADNGRGHVGPADWIGSPGQGVLIVPGFRILDQEPFASIEKALRQAFGSPEEYRRYLRPIVERFADFVQLTPASRHSHHNQYGGLLHHSLNVGVNALNEIKEIDKVLPPCGLLADHEIAKFKPQIKALIATYAIGHDLAKITTAMRITIFNERNPKEHVSYDDAPDNQRFSQSLYEAGQAFAGRYGLPVNTVRFRWSWTSGALRHQHDRPEHVSAACVSLLGSSPIKFADLLIAFYIPGCAERGIGDWRFPLHTIQNHHFNIIAPLIKRADKKSASDIQDGRHTDPRDDSTLQIAGEAMQLGAQLGFLRNCPMIQNRMFVNTDILVKLMSSLHEYEDFSALPQDPRSVDLFVAHLRPFLAKSSNGPAGQQTSRFYKHEGERGVLFKEYFSAMLLGFEIIRRTGRDKNQIDLSGETLSEQPQAQNAVDDDSDDAALAPPASPSLAEGENDEPFSDSALLSCHPIPLYDSFDEIDDNDVKIVVIISAFLERLSMSDINNPNIDASLIDSRLTIGRSMREQIFNEIRVLKLGGIAEIKAAAERYTHSHWRIQRNDIGKYIIVCTSAYTRAILTKDRVHPALIVRGKYDGPQLRPFVPNG